MSCSLASFGVIQDIPAVRRFLFPHLNDEVKMSTSSDTADGWDDANWEDFDVTDETDSSKKPDESWFQDCCVSLSPSHDVLVIAYAEKAVFLIAKWDDEGAGGNKYQISFKGNLNLQDGERITSVMCVPLASQKRSSQGGPDWTCIMIGFSSGYIRMYTENGCLLISQLLHEEPVLRLKCRTYELPRHPGVAEQMEELTILYPTVVVTIDGFSLFQSLRACRNQLARAAASGTDVIQPPPLAYKKWSLQDQERKNDHISVGVTTPCSFDQMSTASILGGYNASIKPSPPAVSKYITAGTAPYVGFYYALEGSTQPLLSDVAMAVASKLKSALFSAASDWFGFKSQGEDQSKNKKPKVEPAASLPIRFGLPDLRRHGYSVTLSPSHTLAVTTDSFGRVLLIDANKGIAVRIWKGYRDAQCGWIEVLEDVHAKSETPEKKGSRVSRSKGRTRKAIFLVIYAPRRGILEVWNTQQGPRVAAFNVNKSCRLLCPGFYIMGLNSTSAKTAHPPPFQCCLIQPDGQMKTVHVPFHLALSDKNSKRARDLHLLKKVTTCVHTKDFDKDGWEEALIQTILNMKIPSLKQQALEKVLLCKGLKSTLLVKLVNAVTSQITSQDTQHRDYESKRLFHYCNVQLQLLYSYNAINKVTVTDTQPVSNDDDDEATPSIEQVLVSVLSVTKSEVEQLLNVLNEFKREGQPRVHFKSDRILDVASFIQCFDMDGYHHSDVDKYSEDSARNTASEIPIHLRNNLSEEQTVQLGEFLFKSVLTGLSSVTELSYAVQGIGMSPQLLMSVLLQLWLSNEDQFLKDLMSLNQLKDLILEITLQVNSKEITPPADELSPWWQTIRETLCQTTSVGAALTAAVVARSVAMAMRQPTLAGERAKSIEKFLEDEIEKDIDEEEMKEDISPDSKSMSDEDWVSISLDTEQWNLMVHQLEDLTALSCLLNIKPTKVNQSQVSAASKSWSSSQDSAISTADTQIIEVSVDKVLHGGKGIMSEVVARWVAKYSIPPTVLSDLSQRDGFQRQSSHVAMETESAETQEEREGIQDVLSRLRVRFPVSLEPDLLYAHCSWQYVVLWNKHTEVTQYLQQSLVHLNYIRNAVIQHGIASMMWHTFVVKKVSGTAYLMEKVGKAPKDRLCRRDTGLSDTALTEFMGIVCELLLKIYQIEVESSVVPTFTIEDTWQKIEGPTSIAELAIDQPLCNYALVDLHRQLSTIMHAVLYFTMKSVKPLSMFDSKGRNAMFKDFNSNPPMPSHEIDVALLNTRQMFLCRVTTAAVGCLDISTRCSSTVVSLEWPSTVLQLGMALDVDVDLLKRHYVCQLYASGYDTMAQEVLATIREHAEMGTQLLQIVGQRLSHVVVSPERKNVEKLSRLPPSLVSWIKSLAGNDIRNTKTSLDDTALLIGHIVNQLPEDHTQYTIAVQLVEAIDSLK
ncbi:rab3 GTPase-activating protein non-catalytic subunit-like [Glandiceps talaboti]